MNKESRLEIETVRQNVRSGRYQVKLHAVQHALKEGFGEQQMVDAVLSGQIVEEYPDRQRALICGQTIVEPEAAVLCPTSYSNGLGRD